MHYGPAGESSRKAAAFTQKCERVIDGPDREAVRVETRMLSAAIVGTLVQEEVQVEVEHTLHRD